MSLSAQRTAPRRKVNSLSLFRPTPFLPSAANPAGRPQLRNSPSLRPRPAHAYTAAAMQPEPIPQDAIASLIAEMDKLKQRVAALEALLREDHCKLEKLEHEHEHDHSLIEKLEHPDSTSYYTGRRTIPVGL